MYGFADPAKRDRIWGKFVIFPSAYILLIDSKLIRKLFLCKPRRLPRVFDVPA